LLDGGSGDDRFVVKGYDDAEINVGTGSDTIVLVEGFGSEEFPSIDINGFDPVNDILDLSRLDANVANEEGDQAFTIIGPDALVDHTVRTIGFGYWGSTLYLKLYNSLGQEDVTIILSRDMLAPDLSSSWIIL